MEWDAPIGEALLSNWEPYSGPCAVVLATLWGILLIYVANFISGGAGLPEIY